MVPINLRGSSKKIRKFSTNINTFNKAQKYYAVALGRDRGIFTSL